jgi:hypothetical protein
VEVGAAALPAACAALPRCLLDACRHSQPALPSQRHAQLMSSLPSSLTAVFSAWYLLPQVDVLVEMREATTVIPRNSLIEANQSGLIAEPLIDITPQPPIPQYKGEPVKQYKGD